MAAHFPDSNNPHSDPYASPHSGGASNQGYEGGSAQYPGAQVNPQVGSGARAGNPYGAQHNPYGPQGNQYGAQDNQHGTNLDPQASTFPGQPSAATFSRSLAVYAIVELAIVSALILLWLNEIITGATFLIALIIVIIGATAVMASKTMAEQRRREAQSGIPGMAADIRPGTISQPSSTSPTSGIVDTTRQNDWRPRK